MGNKEEDAEDLYDQTEYSSGEYEESDEHVPTTESIRATYATDYYMVTVGSKGTPVGRAAAFDRWLASVREQAWDECTTIIEDRFFGGPTKDMLLGWLVNPYQPPLSTVEDEQ